MNVLIALLGDTPGVVTGAYYALAYEGVTIARVVTVTTQDAVTAEQFVADELDRRRNAGYPVEYALSPDGMLLEPQGDLPRERAAVEAYRALLREALPYATRVRIPYRDVNDAAAVACFREV